MQKIIIICGLIMLSFFVFTGIACAENTSVAKQSSVKTTTTSGNESLGNPEFEKKANKLLDKMKLASYYVSLFLAIWGAWEWMIGSPSGWDRVKKAVLGFMLILFLPTFLMWIRDAFSSF